jgi:hypothetical protein
MVSPVIRNLTEPIPIGLFQRVGAFQGSLAIDGAYVPEEISLQVELAHDDAELQAELMLEKALLATEPIPEESPFQAEPAHEDAVFQPEARLGDVVLTVEPMAPAMGMMGLRAVLMVEMAWAQKPAGWCC